MKRQVIKLTHQEIVEAIADLPIHKNVGRDKHKKLIQHKHWQQSTKYTTQKLEQQIEQRLKDKEKRA